jgi:hypothetical protein
VSPQSAHVRLASARAVRSSTARARAASSLVIPLLSPAARGPPAGPRGGELLLARAGRRSSYVGRAGTAAEETALRHANA